MIEINPTALPEASSALIRLLTIGLGLVVCIFLVSFVYNIWFHPLANHPGPKLWAATRLKTIYHIIRGDLVYRMKELHDEYGPVVRYSPTEISYCSETSWKSIYGHRKVELQKVLDGRGGPLKPPDGIHNIITAGREDHSRLRRNLAHAFSEKALRDQEGYIQKYVSLLIDGLRKHGATGEPQDMVKWYNFTTFDVIGDLAFGEPFGSLQQNEYHTWILTIIRMIKAIPYNSLAVYMGIPIKVLKHFIPKELGTARMEMFQISHDKMNRRLAKEEDEKEDRKDFTSYMTRHNDEKSLSVQEIRNMAPILIIAGSETTATLLSGVTYYMLKNPAVYDKIVEEIRSAFQKEDEITILNVAGLKYTSAVLEEGLRMYPPVPTILPRLIEQGEEIEGRYVPPGATVGVHQYSSHYSEDNFYRADEFVPERWLSIEDGGSEEFANDKKGAFSPFSFGPRNCLGKNLAYAEMRVILARVLFNFDLQLEKECADWADQRAPMIWLKRPLMAKVMARS